MKANQKLTCILLISTLLAIIPGSARAALPVALGSINQPPNITTATLGEGLGAVPGASADGLNLAEGQLVENTVSGLSLALGQAVILHYSHLTSGSVNWVITQTRPDPNIALQFSLLQQPAEAEAPSELHSELITAESIVGSQDEVGPGDVMIVLTPRPVPEHNEAIDNNTTPIIVDIIVSGDLELNEETPPTITATSPANRTEVWGKDKYVTFGVTTAPFYPVYFGTSDQAVAADAKGRISQSMQLGDGLINSMQAFTVGPSGHISLVTVTVLKHWVIANPAKPLVLNRGAGISVVVPNASIVDLAQSTMELDGKALKIQSDLTQNIVYALPSPALTIGAHQVTLSLVSQASETGGPSRLLDTLSWQLLVPGDRQAKLWPNHNTCLVNNLELTLEAAPYIDANSGLTMIPFRFLGDLMGAQVGWEGVRQKVTFQLGEKSVELYIGQKAAYVDGLLINLKVAPSIVNSRTMVPLRFVIENLGAQIDWDAQNKEITVQVSME